ncbi:MAG: PIG-L family deacetylase [Chloroflexi bacterium]|nr:PIG-L family deacetylase [Chloroflexota bacterium]
MANQKSILGVYAHPDDEQGVSGLFHKYARAGVETSLIIATRGEVGEIAPGVDATPATLGQVRENEMRRAAQKIGIQHLHFLDYRDSGMMGTPENQDARNLWQANTFAVAEKITQIIRQRQPQVILTFDAFGGYGHPDHIKIHQATLMAYFVAGDPRAFPEQLQNGLAPWNASKVYWTAFPKSRFEQYVKMADAAGMEMPEPMKEFLKRAQPDEVITARIDVAEFVDLKLESLACHASQMNPNSIWSKIPAEIRREGMKTETLICAESRLGRAQRDETDLFQGIE